MKSVLNAHLPFLEKVSQFRMTKQRVQLLIHGGAKIHPQVCLTTQTPCPSKSRDATPGGCSPPAHPQAEDQFFLWPQSTSQEQVGPLYLWQQQPRPWGLLLASCYLVSLGLYPTPGLQLSPAEQLPWLLKKFPFIHPAGSYFWDIFEAFSFPVASSEIRPCTLSVCTTWNNHTTFACILDSKCQVLVWPPSLYIRLLSKLLLTACKNHI